MFLSLSSMMGQESVSKGKRTNEQTEVRTNRQSAIVNDSTMYIGQDVDSLTEEEQCFNPVYLLVQKGKEYLKEQLIRGSVCDCDTTQANRRIGIFSVAPDKHVAFSQGNLQYFPAAKLWKFADEQYEYLGSANKYLTPTFRNWVDLFGWSANNTTAPFGVSISTNVANYAGAFVDWGTNTICGDAPNTWRTLSANEWKYLFEQRKNALQLRSKGSVNGHRGHILLPDDWVLPEGVQFVAEPDNLTMELEINTYTPAEWSIMEEAGAVFLPAAGRRDGTTVGYLVEYSGVWSSTSTTNTNAFHTYYNYESQIIEHHWTSATSRINGRSVRLVHDTIVPIPEYVDLGLSVKWATFNVGASKPEDYGDYFAWGETEPKETYSWATYKWGTSSNLTKYNTTDGKTILDPEDDAAHVNWGSKWRMPTKEEQKELIDSCTWEWTTSNNINGYRVTGPNGHSIFLPAGGVRIDDVSYAIDEFGYYWSSSSTIDDKSKARSIVFTPTSNSCDSDWLYRGRKIRPVYDDSPPKRIGVFSVSADKQVSFSQGNLQYTQSTDEWHFAREQYEYIGAANIKDGALADRIDLFGWSANNTTAPFGVSMSTNNADYAGEFVDWGTNIIQGDAANTWRTLSKEEWEYLIKGRKNASNLRAAAQVNGVNGMILLPDDWECPEGIDFKGGYHTSKGSEYYAEYQQFTKEQWRELETTGAIFLPAAGMHDGNGIADIQAGGYYWSATDNGDTYAYTLISQSSGAYLTYDNRYDVRAVRLVHDTIVPKVEPEYMDLGLSVKWATFNVGASKPEDYGDYFAWGETEPKDEYKWENYKWCNATEEDVFINGTTQEISEDKLTKYNAADGLITLLPEDDAATANWGNKWRMPTRAECQELIDDCTWEKTTLNGVIGYRITGSNNNSIFLPEAGYKYYESSPTCGSYWPANGKGRMAHTLHWWNPNKVGIVDGRKYCGVPIRPVYDDIPEPCLVVKVNDTLSINMMCVEGGTFTMGDGDNAHPVSLSSYSIGQTEVTQALWEAVMGTNPSANTANKQLPVTNISWFDCQEFIKKLNQLTGMRFRLPTEAEWEYAARGGQKSKGYTYAGSNDLKEVAWYNGNSGNTLHAVAQKKPNEWGIYDMSGNVWEWCHDWYASYPTTHQYNPLGPEVGQVVGKRYIRMFRGGSYGYEAAYHQNTFRDITGPEPDTGTANLGLRLVLSDEVNFKTIHVNDTLAFHMMDVKGGTFMMGADKAEVNPKLAATPVHPVTLSDYYVGETQITQVLWMTIMGTSIHDELEKGGGDYLGEGDDYPMYAISWYDCQEFISKLNQQTGLQFSMPTEAEWEYAARGGQLSRGYQYAGSDNLDEVAWHTGNSKKVGGKVAVSPVKLKKPNELGLYDMTGNIWEWCLDRDYLYTPEPQTNPLFSRAGNQLAIERGGSTSPAWGNDSYYVYYRFPYNASTKRTRVGIRLVLHDTVPVSPEPEYVDLGLSVKWATFNVGATSPEDYGDYFAWGETETKKKYEWSNYRWCNPTDTTMTKYCVSLKHGYVDNLVTLETNDDIAAQLGSQWRMPTDEEWEELRTQCTWYWINKNHINGYKIVGKNGNSIFLPVAGYKANKTIYDEGTSGAYWSSSLYVDQSLYAYGIIFNVQSVNRQYNGRFCGLSVRTVHNTNLK